ncbi:urease subunit beta [Cryobacterium sp. N22]|uniref:urease subunit beta n=1 Tax=Cryobacterium sp. N22 TaxID=2048290 RepID=UPI000CE577E9|nr:urease subunit beta [Cryobacterium sp. N22]
MIRKGNPFATPYTESAPILTVRFHPSDDPGRDYPDQEQPDPAAGADRHLSSGVGAGSEPRRPGTNLRQAPRRLPDPEVAEADLLIPGEIILAAGDVEINAGMEVTTIRVENTADRPIQVGSHYHFAEVNAGLSFDRDAAWGKRLNVLSGGSARFEPGAAEVVELVPIQGRRIVEGLRGLCGGKLDG